MSDGAEIYRLKAPGPDGGLWDYAGYSGDNIYKHGGPQLQTRNMWDVSSPNTFT